MKSTNYASEKKHDLLFPKEHLCTESYMLLRTCESNIYLMPSVTSTQDSSPQCLMSSDNTSSRLFWNKPPKTSQAKVVASQQRWFQREQHITDSEAKGGFCPLKHGAPTICQNDTKNLKLVPKNSNLILKIHLFSGVVWVYKGRVCCYFCFLWS